MSIDLPALVATQPSTEEIALGALPGLPGMWFHRPLIDIDVGNDFTDWGWKVGDGELEPFVLVIEGSIPNESFKSEGERSGFGNQTRTNAKSSFAGQSITTSEWIDRLGPKAEAVLAVGTCATDGGIHTMAGNPTGTIGVPDYLGWQWRSKAGHPIVRVPGCPIQPDNLSKTILYLLYPAGARTTMIPLDETPCGRPGCSAKRSTRGATVPATTSRRTS